MKDVIVVGGGPAGSWISAQLAKKGFEVTILEEHGEIGNPMCCAGILGKDRIKKIGIDPMDWSINELERGVFHSPEGEMLEITRGRTEACVINRSEFDRDLAERAVRSGADLVLGTRCRTVSRSADGVVVKSRSRDGVEEVRGRMIIGADGTNSVVGRSFGLIEEFSPTVCLQAEIVAPHDESSVHVYLGNDISASFFGWTVPAGDVVRVGLGDKNGCLPEKFSRLLRSNSILPQSSEDRIVRCTTGLIPSVKTRSIYDDRAILVGDAAGQVKPLTGGGLYLGLRCADMGAEIVEEALEEGMSEETLQSYENGVLDTFGKEFEYGRIARNLLEKMDDEDIGDFLGILRKSEVRERIIDNADFDHHSELLKILIKEAPHLVDSLGVKNLAKYLGWLTRIK